MDESKAICGCEGGKPEFHTRVIDDSGITSDKIIDIRNPRTDSRIVLKVCSKCHQVFGFWGGYFGSDDISDKDKEVARSVLNQKQKSEDKKDDKEESRIITPE